MADDERERQGETGEEGAKAKSGSAQQAGKDKASGGQKDEPQSKASRKRETSGASSGKTKTPGVGEVLRDMGVGALVGAVVGAAWRVARTVQPEGAEAVKGSITGAAREMASAAGNAVGDVLASKPVNQLLPTKIENGKRAEVMKSTLKEAVAAAGDAAKGVLESKGKTNADDDG
jgi:hypothetical protein